MLQGFPRVSAQSHLNKLRGSLDVAPVAKEGCTRRIWLPPGKVLAIQRRSHTLGGSWIPDAFPSQGFHKRVSAMLAVGDIVELRARVSQIRLWRGG